MADLNLIVSQIRQRLEILYQEIDKIESGGGGSPEDAYTKAQSDALFVKKVAGKGLSTNDFTDAYENQIDTNTTNITNLTTDVNSKMPLGVGTGLTTTGTWDLFTLPVGKYHRTTNVSAVANIPADLNVAFYCIIENTISGARKHITLYPAHVDGQSFFYTCLETGAGFGPWYKFQGTVVSAPTTLNANLTTLSEMKTASLDVENPEDELI